jgi:hypothetical protein
VNLKLFCQSKPCEPFLSWDKLLKNWSVAHIFCKNIKPSYSCYKTVAKAS